MEVYTNQFLRDLSSNYTAGDTSLHVSSAAPVAVQTGTFRVRLANTQNTLLKVTAGAATTTWTVTAEANDASCAAASNAVLGCEVTAGMIDGIKADILAASAFPFPVTAPPAYSAWSWLNQGTATGGDITTPAGVYLRAPNVSGTNLRVLKRAAPATPWTATISVIPLMQTGGNTRAGLCVYNSGNGRLVSIGMSNDTSTVADNWNSTTSFSGTLANFQPAATTRAPMHFYRIANDGTNLTLAISADSYNYITLLTPTLAAFISAVTDIGFFIDSEANGKDVILTLVHCSGW